MTRSSLVKRAIVALVGGVGVLGFAAAVVLGSVFAGKAPMVDGVSVEGLEVIKSGHVSSYLLPIGPRELALIDTGDDAEAHAILAAIARRGLRPEAVKAVLLTHGDYDHIAGAHVFAHAPVMALAAEVDLVEGRAVRGPLRRPKPTGIRVNRVLYDGDPILLGKTRVEVFAIPGHTSGSAAFLVNGALLLGDSADTTQAGKLAVGAWLFSADRGANRRSLRTRAGRLARRSDEIKAIACSHSGVLTRGLAPLTDLAATLEP